MTRNREPVDRHRAKIDAIAAREKEKRIKAAVCTSRPVKPKEPKK